jgi:hypothetical protein
MDKPGQAEGVEADRMGIAMVTAGKRGPNSHTEEVKDYAKRR